METIVKPQNQVSAAASYVQVQQTVSKVLNFATCPIYFQGVNTKRHVGKSNITQVNDHPNCRFWTFGTPTAFCDTVVDQPIETWPIAPPPLEEEDFDFINESDTIMCQLVLDDLVKVSAEPLIDFDYDQVVDPPLGFSENFVSEERGEDQVDEYVGLTCFACDSHDVFACCGHCDIPLCGECFFLSEHPPGVMRHSFAICDRLNATQGEERMRGLYGGGLNRWNGETDLATKLKQERHQKMLDHKDEFERAYLAVHLPFFGEMKLDIPKRRHRRNRNPHKRDFTIPVSNRFCVLPVHKDAPHHCWTCPPGADCPHDVDSEEWYPIREKIPSYCVDMPRGRMLSTDTLITPADLGYDTSFNGECYYVTVDGLRYGVTANARCPDNMLPHLAADFDLDRVVEYFPSSTAEAVAMRLGELYVRAMAEGKTVFELKDQSAVRENRAWRKNWRRRAARAVLQRKERAISMLLAKALAETELDRAVEADLMRLRRIDESRGVYYRTPCGVITCDNKVVCEFENRCGLHCRCQRKRRIASRTMRAVRALPREELLKTLEPVLSGNAQSLFSVEHIISMPAVGELVNKLSELTNDKNIMQEVVILLVSYGVQIFRTPTQENVMTCIFNFCMSFATMRKLAASLLASVQKLVVWVFSKPNAESAAEGVGKLFAGLIGLAAILVPALLVSKLPSDKSITDFINRFSKIGQCIRSSEVITEYLKPVIDWATEYVRTQFLGLDPQQLDAWSQIDTWCDDVMGIHNASFETDIQSNATLREKVETLIIRGDKILQLLDSLKIPVAQRQRVSNLMLFLHKARGIAAHSGSGYTAPRIAPLVVHFTGGTGVGKSSMLTMLCSQILYELGCRDPKDLKEKVYFRTSTEFWDGFNSSMQICIVDDIGQVKDVAGVKNEEAMDVIRMANTAHFNLNMANLEAKGNTVFRCPVVIWTSNLPSVRFESLTFPDAVSRRVDLKFEQRPAPAFRKTTNINGKNVEILDKHKVDEHADEDVRAYEDCIEFYQYKTPASNSCEKDEEPLKFQDMANIVLHHLTANIERGNKFNDFQLAYFDKLIETGGVQNDLLHVPGPVINQEPTFIGKAFGGKSHVDVLNSMSHYEPQLVNVDEVEEIHFYPGIRTAACVQMHYKLVDRFMTGFVTAQDWIDRHNVPTAERDERFNAIFFHVTQILPCQVVVCEEHRPSAAKAAWTRFRRRMNAFWANLYRYPGECKRDFDATLTRVWVEGTSVEEWVTNSEGQTVLKNMGRMSNGQPCLDENDRAPQWFYYFSYLGGVVGVALRALVAFFAVRGIYRIFCSLYEKFIDSGEVEKYDTSRTTSRSNTGRREKYDTSRTRGHQNTGRRENDNSEFDSPLAEYEWGKNVFLEHGCLCGGFVRSGNCKTHVEFDCQFFRDWQKEMLAKIAESTKNSESALDSGLAQKVLDQNAAEIASTAVNNIYRLDYKARGEWHACQNVVFLAGRVALTNRHLMVGSEAFSEWRIVNYNFRLEFDLHNCRMVTCENSPFGDRDLMLIEFPRNVPQHRDIRKFFCTPEDFGYFKTVENVSLLGFAPSEQLMLRQYFSNACTAEDTMFRLVDDAGPKMVRSYFRYAIQTRSGDCGAIMILYDKNRNRKIAGIHMAGLDAGKFTGVAQAVHTEVIDFLMDKLECRHLDSLIPMNVEASKELVVHNVMIDECCGELRVQKNIQGDFMPLGAVEKPVYKNVESRIKESPLHGVIAVPTMKPAYLRPFTRDGVRYNPLEQARAKASTPSIEVDDVILNACIADVFNKVCVNLREEDKRILTFEEAIKGIEGDDFVSGINRSTSPGYGWEKKGKGKMAYLSNPDGSWRTDHPEVVAACDSLIAKCKRGERPCTYWTDTLKDERRDVAKVNQGKTRLFSAGEMAYTICFRQYFLPFTAHMMRNRIDFESCVGINVYNYEWTHLATVLQSKGKHVIAGDFSNYDGTLVAPILWGVLDLIEKVVPGDEETQMIRRCLWSEIVHSIHVDGDQLYSWTHSQPSGCPMTAVLNSLYHSISVRYVYVLCAQKSAPEMLALTNFNKYVAHVNYGDDDVSNISETIIDWFNQVEITEAYLALGMIYTDEAKTGEIVKSRTLDEITFLKRKFRWDPEQNRYRAPLALATVREMPMWVRGSVDVQELTAETLAEAVHELAQWDKDTFEREFPALDNGRRKLIVPVDLQTYEFYQRIEAFRWGSGAAQNKHRDRGSEQMVESSLAANPAGVVTLPRKRARRNRRERYSPLAADVCPSNKNRLSAQPISGKFKSTPGMNTGLAQSNTNDEQGQLDIEPMAHEDTQQILTFAEEGIVATAGEASRTLRQYYVDAEDDLPNDIVGFLSRPIAMANFEWLSNTGLITSLAHIDLPVDWTTKTVIGQKIQGFRYLRCDFVVRVQVNAQPFNAGRLIVAFNPFEKQLQTAPSNFIHFGGLTGYRHVDLDLAEATAVELRIPFTGPMSHFDLVTAAQCILGTVHTLVYSPLTGSANVDGIMWCWAENIDIQMPTGLPIHGSLTETVTGVAQSGMTRTPGRKNRGTGPNFGPTLPKYTGVAGQVDVTGPLDRLNAKIEAEKNRPGTVETIARSTSSLAKSFLAVPILGAYARTLSWLADATAGLAHVFGWSKPTDPEFSTSIQYRFGQHLGNFNGDSKAKIVALDARNETDVPAEVYGTNVDEMAIKSIISRPTYMDRFSFDNTQQYGDLLWKWPVDATSCLKDVYDDESPPKRTGIRRYNNYVSYCAALFDYWRGSLCYHFKVVKTPFHSGRIRVIWVPGANPTTVFSTIDENKCYSEVHDLRQTTSFDVCVPFTWNLPWKNSTNGPSNVTDINPCWDTPTGMLYVTVVNALKNPTTCADKIDIIVEESAGEDFQFAYPHIVYDNYKVWMRANLSPTESGRAQSMYPSGSVSDASINALGMGEVIASFRQVLKRYMPFADIYAHDDGKGSKLASGQAYRITPYVTSWLDCSVGQNLHENTWDYFSLVASMYRFMNGSMRILVNEPNSSSNIMYWEGNHTSSQVTNYALLLSSAPEETKAKPYAFQYLKYEPLMELQLPFYSSVPTVFTSLGLPSSAGELTALKAYYGTGPSVNVKTTDAVNVYRATGEDFSFGYLLGVPVTVVDTT